MLFDGEVVVRIVALSVALVQDEVAIRDAVDAHVHDGFVPHRHRHASLVAAASMALLARMLTLFALARPHAVLLVVLGLRARALRAHMLPQTVQSFLRALNLSLLVRLHRLLLGLHFSAGEKF